MHEPVKAEGFIWLIVGVFWVIAQIAGAAAKKNPARRPLPGTGEESGLPADPLGKLLRKLSGAEEFRTEPPTFAELPKEKTPEQEPPRRSEVRTKNPWKPGDIEALPDIKPLRRSVTEPAAASVLPKIDARPKMSAFRNSIPSIKMPTMNMSFQGSATSVQTAPNLGKILNPTDKSSIRRAMLSHIIFSPPKALEKSSG